MMVNKIYEDGTYLKNNVMWHEEDSAWKSTQIHKIIIKNHLHPKSTCDVGCGAGEILRLLKKLIPDSTYDGYEISPNAFNICNNKSAEGLNFYFCDVTSTDIVYDLLLCIDVFEHVEDYIGFIKSLKNKSTHKIFHIPLDISVLSILHNSLIRARVNVGHLHYFTKDTALATLKDSGYEVIDYFYTPGFKDLPGKTFKSKLAKIPRLILFSILPDLMVKMLGGCSLIVLAK